MCNEKCMFCLHKHLHTNLQADKNIYTHPHKQKPNNSASVVVVMQRAATNVQRVVKWSTG